MYVSLLRIWKRPLRTLQMPNVVFDNCVLSNFALTEALFIVKRLYAGSAFITDFVYAENTRGILRGYQGLSAIREAIKAGWIKELSLESGHERTLFEMLSVSLGCGEASSIVIAKERGYVFACDDRTARREASLLGVKLTGTLGILVKSIKRKIISSPKGDEIMQKMIANGFYSPVKSVKELL